MTTHMGFEAYFQLGCNRNQHASEPGSSGDDDGDTETLASMEQPANSQFLTENPKCSIPGCNRSKANGDSIHYHHWYETDPEMRKRLRSRYKRYVGRFRPTQNPHLLMAQKEEMQLCRPLCALHHIEAHRQFRAVERAERRNRRRNASAGSR